MSAGFGKGNVGFVVFDAGPGLPEDWMDRMGAQPLPPLGELEERVHGWCGWRHAQDRDFTDDGLKRGGYPTGLLMTAERQIPASTLAAEVALEEMAVMKAEGKEYLNQQTRSEIKKSIRERLLPDMPVVFRGAEWVYAENSGLVFCTAMTEKAMDSFMLMWMQTFGVALRVFDPDGLAESRGYKPGDWPAVAFGRQGELFCDSIGSEFLMWLWRASEKCGGLVQVEGYGEFAYMLEGPLVLATEGKTITVKSDKAALDVETAAALAEGLTLQKCRFMLARGEEVWNCTLDAEGFVFRGMKLPQTESFNIHDCFAERVALLGVFHAALTDLFMQYCLSRSSAGWKAKVRVINDWIDGKVANHRALGSRDLTTEGNVDISIGTNVLKRLTGAADLAVKLYERREDLEKIMHGTYPEKVEPYMKLVRAEMKVSEVDCLNAALQLGKDMEKDGGPAVAISLQLVAGLEVHEQDAAGNKSTTEDTEGTGVSEKKKDGKPQNSQTAEEKEPSSKDTKVDDLIEQAIEIIRETNRASTSSLQRRLKIGYTRAARVMDLLEERGVIGPPDGVGPREILLSTDGTD